MKLNQLNYFIEVCNSMNITQAAKKLHISQPSLTVAIKNLEQELGVNLLLREKNKITLTSEGEFFRDQLYPILGNLENLKREMVSSGSNYNVLKMGIPPMIGSFLFPLLFSRFITQNPDIKLEIVEHGAMKSQELLLNEKLDLTFLIGESQLNSELIFTPISQRDLKLYINKKHALAEVERISIKDLKDVPLIMFNSEFYVSRIVKDTFNNYGINANIILETSQINTVTRFIREELAGSILIDGCIPDTENFKVIPIDEIAPITIGFAKKKRPFHDQQYQADDQVHQF